MEYNIMSSPLLYDLTITSTSGTKSTENTYLYGDIQPGAPVKVGDAEYKYDASGNPVSMRGGDSDRTLRYDAENRLRVIEDTHNGTMSLYTYNHTGERSLKRYGAFNTAYLNGAYAGSGLDGLTRYSAYISPYYVEHGTGTNASNATKHYYIGTERLVSKLVTSVNKKDDVKEEENTYYYFTDHLGSTTHITDKGGKVVQYAAYTPYGTLFREYKSVMPYKFNGKELDQETGYYYYGARYYDPSAAFWIGVDPLQMKYPDVSPYVYCAGNPVKYVDPDGREIHASSAAECQMILNTLPKDIRSRIIFDENGFVDKSSLKNIDSSSGNFNSFSQLVNSEIVFNVILSDEVTYKNENGELINKQMGEIYTTEDYDGSFGFNTGEEGWTGVCQTPGNAPEKYNSTDNSVNIVVNSKLSDRGKAQTFAHEGYGHAYLYSKGLKHTHQVVDMQETNLLLKDAITKATKETINNMSE